MNMKAAACMTAELLGCPHTECHEPILCSERCMRLVRAREAIGDLLDVEEGFDAGEWNNTPDSTGRALPQLTGDAAPCSHLCYCERGANRAEIARLQEALRLAQAWMLPAEVGSSGALKKAHTTVREALGLAVDEQSVPTPPSFNNVDDMLKYLNDDDKRSGS